MKRLVSKLRLKWALARYHITVFVQAWKLWGWRVAVRGRYYLQPADHELTYREQVERNFQREYRHNPPNHYELTPDVRKGIARAIYGGNAMIEDDCADIGYVGEQLPCGLDYEYPKENE